MVSTLRVRGAEWKLTELRAKETLNKIALNPDLAPFLALLKTARNGAVYGSKVRFPHALV